MQVIQCPNCKRVLGLKQAVTNAKIKCRDCNTVFVGSSREATAEESAGRHHHRPPSSSAGARPAKPSAHRSPYDSEAPSFLSPAPPARPQSPGSHAPPHSSYPASQGGYPPQEEPYPEEYEFKRKGVPLWVWITLMALPVILLGVGMMAYYYNRNPYVELTDAQGNVVYAGKFNEEQKADLETRIKTKDEQEKKRRLPVAPVGEAKFTAGPAVSLTTVSTSEGQKTAVSIPLSSSGPSVPETPGRDEKVNVTNLKAVETQGVPDEGVILGEVWNHHDTVLLAADVTVEIFDAQNKRIGNTSAKVGSIPPGRNIPFSATYNGVKYEDISRIDGSALPRMAGPNYIAWVPELRDSEFDRNMTTKKFTVSGKTKSPVKVPLTNIMAHCTFYGMDNTVAGYVDVPAGNNGDCPAGERVEYMVVFDTATTNVLPEVVDHYVLRIVAKKMEFIP